MSFSHDRRGQSVVVGTVILFGFLILALSIYQVQFVPAENSEIEFEHSQEVEGDFQDLRNALLSGGTTGEARSTSIRLGTRYPQRTFFLNPPPASGSLETTAEENLTISDARVGDGVHENVEKFWNDTGFNFDTRSIRYTPNYNEYRGAPELVYENSLVVAEFGDRALPRSNQTIVRDERLSLTVLSGELSESGVEARSVDSETVSRGPTRIPVTGEGEQNFTVSLPSAVSNTEDLVDRLERLNISAEAVTANGSQIDVTLNGSQTYRLALAEVSVDGSGETEPAYIVPVGSEEVTAGQSVGVEVRDKFNNPVGGTEVVISDQDNRTTDNDGRVFFNPESDDSTASINGSFDSEKPDYESVDFTVSSAGEGGDLNRTYTVSWDEDNLNMSTGSDKEINGTVKSNGEPLTNATVDFATNNSSIATFQGENNTSTTTVDGNFTTNVSTGSEEGNVTLFAASGDDVDRIEVEVYQPLTVNTTDPSNVGTDRATLNGDLVSLGISRDVEVFFQYRETGESEWINTSRQPRTTTGPFNETIEGLESDTQYEFRAVAGSADRTSEGEIETFSTDSESDPTPITEFESASASNLVEDSDDETQIIAFSLDGDLTESEEVEIDLSDAQDRGPGDNPTIVNYPDSGDDPSVINVESGNGSAEIEQEGRFNAVVTYTVGSEGDPAGNLIEISISQIEVGDDLAGEEFDVEFEHLPTGVEETSTFGIAETSGDITVSGTREGALFSAGSITVEQDGIIEEKADADGSITMEFNSEVEGSITSGDMVSIGQESTVGGEVSANGPVTMEFDSTVEGSITSQDVVSIGQQSIVGGDVSANGAVSVGPDSTVEGTVSSRDTVTIKEDSTVQEGIDASGSVVIEPRATVESAVSDGSVLIAQNAVVENEVIAGQSVELGYQNDFGGTVQGSITAGGDVSVPQDGEVGGDVTTDGTVELGFEGMIEGDVFVSGASDIVCGQGAMINGQACEEYVDENY